MIMDGEFWRKNVLTDLISYWYEHVRDEAHGAFYLNLSRQWQPMPPWDKVPAMISRQVFAFSAAYLLSGEERYLEVAREGADYLLEHAWDRKYGGWFDGLTQTGAPKGTIKSVNSQLYTNVGLALYYFTTGDERVRARIEESIRIRRTAAHDDPFGGYYQALNRDLSVHDDGKNKHAHYGYVGSFSLNYWLATRDPDFLQWTAHLTDLTLERMTDPEEGWVYGFHGRFDRQWKHTPHRINGAEVASIGAQLTAVLSFLRLYHQTGNATYLEHGKMLGDKISRYGWDAERGGWYDLVEKAPPYRPVASPSISWWIQIYGCFLQLHLYHLTQEEQYLERFRKSERFYERYFVDHEYGGVFGGVSPDGALVGDGRKAGGWQTSYHEIEHGLLNYLYLNLYVNQRPVVLHFRLDGPGKHFVSLADDPSVRISGVRIDGASWVDFDARERSVALPDGKGLHVEVTLAP
ncbi:MAG: AGE family epimerase/isomerase [Candidatus Latescibacteria bacterium]|nr:AGE family epimerase/isomerase [Candidatus Latescibacterota bacterium]